MCAKSNGPISKRASLSCEKESREVEIGSKVWSNESNRSDRGLVANSEDWGQGYEKTRIRMRIRTRRGWNGSKK